MTEQVSSEKIHRAWGTVLLRLQRLSDPEWVDLSPQVFTRVLGFGTVLRRHRAATLWNSRPCSICLRKIACTVGRCDIFRQIRRLWLSWRVKLAFGGFVSLTSDCFGEKIGGLLYNIEISVCFMLKCTDPVNTVFYWKIPFCLLCTASVISSSRDKIALVLAVVRWQLPVWQLSTWQLSWYRYPYKQVTVKLYFTMTLKCLALIFRVWYFGVFAKFGYF